MRKSKRILAAVATAVCACALVAPGVSLAAGSPANAKPSFKIVSPLKGSTVTDPVKLKVAVHGVKIGVPTSGDDHLHVSVNGGVVHAVYHNHTIVLKLPAGKNTIGVDLAYPTHMPAAPWQYVTFTVHQ